MLKHIAFMLLFILSSLNVWGEVYFEDTFSNVGSTDNQSISTRTGWGSFSKCYSQGNSGLRVGSKNDAGSVTKAAMTNISGTKDIKVTVYTAKYNTNANTFTVSVTNGTISSATGVGTLSAGKISISPSANAGVTATTSAANWTDDFKTEFTITGASSNTTITFASNKRVILGPIRIEDAGGSQEPTLSAEPSPANSGTIAIMHGETPFESGSEFEALETYTLTATPETGYKFVYWSLSDGTDAELVDDDEVANNEDEKNPVGILMAEETTTVTAHFARPATVGDASNISCTGASFAVSNSANRNNYIVYTTSNTATPSGTWSSLRNGNGSITISSLTKNTTYYYWCASEVASGHYVYTDKKNFTTANNFDLDLTLADGKGNTASAPSYTCIASGTSVTLTASPASGYVVSGWTVLDGSSNEITPTATTATTFTFNMPTSNVTAEAIFQQQVAAPTFLPAAGTYGSAQSVAISTTTPGATIYYTIGTNPADPTTGSTPYTSAISVSSNQTIKAIAVKDGMANSAVSTAAYTIKCATPEISLTAGTYTGAQTVTISGPTGATIYYTTNGSAPTTNSSVYSSALTVSSSQTIKAIAVKDGMANSEVASAVYTIQYTITWNDNGGQIGDAVLVNSGSTTYTCPADPSPATRGNCGDRFMGWTDANYSGDEAPTVLFTNSSGTKPAINGNKNFRAVFADYAN